MDYKVLESDDMFFILKEPEKEVILAIDTKEKIITDLTGKKAIISEYGKDRH